ncbi:M15 family metallopeptidase [Lysinibacillus irui]|uniref:M15 family metallopeptidase n=1 Tax=Lysinibacillus irui TaxID=2998077 RepID=A0ABU5NIP1_9BACI|nr:M15 family metallopeptidase [Lysinibacillus irui]MEA0553528.1 M15 family metallopeptidase [Lysinibacillus irui]MEA0975912.1 M15 family metallopeptidase [Lysinibacillus irui]MEA1042066.1 M15 family metallopeptidase [Lysinibacillus irui]
MSTNITTTCRDLDQLLSVAQIACRLLFQECYKEGINNIFITETYRSQERQNYLYAQGRTRPGQIVTWTLSSNHTSRLAWDIAIGPPQSLYDEVTLTRVGAIARKLGITWGGDWTGNKDRPHFEVPKSWKMPANYKLEGQVIVPISSKKKVQLIIVENEEETKVAQAWNPASKAIRTETESYIAQAIKEGVIQESHLEDLRKGVMTTDHLLGLFITIQQRRAN